MLLQSFYRDISGFGGNGDQKAAGSLRIEQQGAIFFRNACSKSDAFPQKIEIIIQSTGNHALASRIEGARKNRNGFILNLNRYRGNSLLRFPEGHFTGVTEYAESGDVSDRVNCSRICFCGDFVERFGGGTIQLGHGSNRGIETCFSCTLSL